MSEVLRKRTRIEQSARRLDRLGGSIEGWLRHRTDKDPFEQYHSQLNALTGTLLGSIGDLHVDLGRAAAAGTVGEAYAACRTADTRAERVRRLFDYYRAKFDQRDDPLLGPVVSTADEVVWSCWSEPYRNAQRTDKTLGPKPAPLPYIEPQYAPAAVPRDDPPTDLRADTDDTILIKFLQKLPVPIISLPAICVDDPWWLVYIGHEVGHHLQNDLSAEPWALVKAFGDLVQDASTAAGPADSPKWRNWSQEIFGDICSVCSMGPFAVRAIAELELGAEKDMLYSDKAKYPPPLVRLAILAEVADELGVGGSVDLGPLGLDVLDSGATDDPRRAGVRRQVELGRALVPRALADPLTGRGPFAELFGWNSTYFAPHKNVWNLREALLDRGPLNVKRSVRAARLLTCAAVAAWEEVATIDDDDRREKARKRLVERFVPAVADSREEITRAAAPTPDADVKLLANEFTRLLVETVPDHTGW